MTDEADSRVESATEGHASPDSDASPDSNGSPAPEASSDPAAESDPAARSDPDTDSRAEFGDLSLPQRIFVASVQNPTRGVVIVGLFAFAFSFYIAFWMIFPRVAAFMSAIGVALVALVALVYVLSSKLSR